ncbi:hypothetical protein ACSFBM_21480 [Variovorax sp. GB1R11]|uniref:hypothetical protein n=1 Tax=Variovorax sp. GB1R11 TaxID=3443741 RepID=UPI003F47C5FF
MGMSKISRKAEGAIVAILKEWPVKQRLTWDSLRKQIAKKFKSAEVWSRQSLGANEAIYSAYEAAKTPDPERSNAPNRSRSWYAKRVIELERKVADLTVKQAALQLRHMQLVHNVSLLPGGIGLLALPLPSNTRRKREDR